MSADCIKRILEYGASFDVTALESVIERKTWQTQNRHQPDELITWTAIRAKFGSATIRECPSCSPRAGITELFLSSDLGNLPCGLKTGMTAKSLIERVGQPHSRSQDALVYMYPPDEQTEVIALVVKKRGLTGIRWRFYND